MTQNLYPSFSFEVQKKDPASRARLGRLKTPHGTLETPAFIFCATKAALKGMAPWDLPDAGTQIILSNTYHLMIQPGGDVIESMGGLHRFMGWQGPMLTDSGGFQIFSLGHGSVAGEIKGRSLMNRKKSLTQITEEGATFRSYKDGTLHTLTPEKAMYIQKQLGADLVVVLDECTPFHVDKDYTRESMYLSHRWGMRSLEAFRRHDDGRQAVYGLIQGGIYPDLREEASAFVNSHGFFGHAIGGTLGATKEQMYTVVQQTTRHLEASRPIHLLGIGGLRDFVQGVLLGVDTFDCVHPTRLARHGGALAEAQVLMQEKVPHGREHFSVTNGCYRRDERPLDPSCPCKTCQTFSRAYLHHAFKAKEMIAFQALTLHNVTHMNRFTQAIRQSLQEGTLLEEAKRWIQGFKPMSFSE